MNNRTKLATTMHEKLRLFSLFLFFFFSLFVSFLSPSLHPYLSISEPFTKFRWQVSQLRFCCISSPCSALFKIKYVFTFKKRLFSRFPLHSLSATNPNLWCRNRKIDFLPCAALYMYAAALTATLQTQTSNRKINLYISH